MAYACRFGLYEYQFFFFPCKYHIVFEFLAPFWRWSGKNGSVRAYMKSIVFAVDVIVVRFCVGKGYLQMGRRD